jgi:hypothetical protein
VIRAWGCLILIAACLLAVAWLVWPIMREERRVHVLRGHVEDDTTHAPVPNARVIVTSSNLWGIRIVPWTQGWTSDTVWTNERGRFELAARLVGEPNYLVEKPGYLRASGSARLPEPVAITMLRIPEDNARLLHQVGRLPQVGLANPFHLHLESGIAPSDSADYDVAVRWGPSGDSTIAIVAGPGRTIQYREFARSNSRWFQVPINACSAPESGYADSVRIRWNTPSGVCFVRRERGPQYGGFGVYPTGLWLGPSSLNRGVSSFDVVFNRSGGRGLCDEATASFQ